METSGGKVSAKTHQKARWIGRGVLGNAHPPARPLILTVASPRLCITTQSVRQSPTIPKPCLYQLSFSEAAALPPCHLCSRPSTGSTACTLAPRWAQKLRPPPPERSA